MQNPIVPSAPPRFAAFSSVCVERGKQKFFRSASASSALSLADAQQEARKRARERAEAAADGRQPLTPEGAYPYPERVLVEPLVERLVSSDPITAETKEIARITRNSYDANVLNAYSVMFVDVDTVADSSNSKAETPVSQTDALTALADLVHDQPELQFRVYSTKAGLRYLCTSRLFDPVSIESQDILKRLKADKRYATLCRVQKCYRARLSPKYWRCLVKPERTGFFARLLMSNTGKIDVSRFSTCRYLETVGSTPASILPEIKLIIQKHDQLSEAASSKLLG